VAEAALSSTNDRAQGSAERFFGLKSLNHDFPRFDALNDAERVIHVATRAECLLELEASVLGRGEEQRAGSSSFFERAGSNLSAASRWLSAFMSAPPAPAIHIVLALWPESGTSPMSSRVKASNKRRHIRTSSSDGAPHRVE